jgi:hypothetical protein
VEITGILAQNVLNVGAVRVAEDSVAASLRTDAEKYRGDYRVSADHVIGIDSFVGDDGKKVLLFSDYKSGLVRRLFRVSDAEYEVGPGFAIRSPVELSVRFVLDSKDRDVSRLLIKGAGRGDAAAIRMSTSEREIRFQSGDTTLAGTLIMPESKGAVPGIILLSAYTRLLRSIPTLFCFTWFRRFSL